MSFSIVEDRKCEGCYGIGKVKLNGEDYIAAVSEKEQDGVIDLINPDTFEVTRASDGPGGGMNIIPLPDRNGEFLCIQKFYPVFKSEDAVVVWGYIENGTYKCKEVQPLPFVHRIELVSVADEDYLICASLCRTKDYQDDWSYPGSVYVGKIDYANRQILDFHVIYTGITQNHGLTKLGQKGENGILISGKNGVNRLVPPGNIKDEWRVENLINEPTSDCAAADIDGDGNLELGTITPFHGEYFNIYKQVNGSMKKIYVLPGKHEFGHAIWGGEFNGRPVFIVGYRAAGKELYLIDYADGNIREHLVDKDGGPSNVTVVSSKAGDLICAANRQTDRWTIYKED